MTFCFGETKEDMIGPMQLLEMDRESALAVSFCLINCCTTDIMGERMRCCHVSLVERMYSLPRCIFIDNSMTPTSPRYVFSLGFSFLPGTDALYILLCTCQMSSCTRRQRGRRTLLSLIFSYTTEVRAYLCLERPQRIRLT